MRLTSYGCLSPTGDFFFAFFALLSQMTYEKQIGPKVAMKSETKPVGLRPPNQFSLRERNRIPTYETLELQPPELKSMNHHREQVQCTHKEQGS
jgi:hypothetical protein